MKKVRVAINGFGRIGRIFLRIAWEDPAFEIVAINSRSEADIYAHLLKYDSIYGPWSHDVGFEENHAIVVDGMPIPLHHEDELEHAPWDAYAPDIVLESTGVFRDRASSEKHLEAGAKCVVISAPAEKEDATLIYGINHKQFDPKRDHIISAASCTTTCLAPIIKVLDAHLGVKHGTIVTTHAYTNDQHLVDHPHNKKSFRRARAAGISVIPTSTGAAKAIGKVIPSMSGKLDGNALRVPIPVPSVLSVIAEVEKETQRDAVNALFREAISEFPEGTLDVSEIGLVSVDYVKSPFAATVDSLSTLVTGGTQVFIQAWYDNEWGYVTQMAKLMAYIGRQS